MANVIFHAHSNTSPDSDVPLDLIISKLRRCGIDALFLTDHNAVCKKQSHQNVTVIPGSEITTADGEVIGLYITKPIARGLPLPEVLRQIHLQKGVAVAPHPMDRLRSKVIPQPLLERYVNDIDAIEVFNSRTVWAWDNARAFSFARYHHKPMLYGSDAHTLAEYCSTWMSGIDYANARSFISSLNHATPHYKRAPIYVHAITKVVRWIKR